MKYLNFESWSLKASLAAFFFIFIFLGAYVVLTQFAPNKPFSSTTSKQPSLPQQNPDDYSYLIESCGFPKDHLEKNPLVTTLTASGQMDATIKEVEKIRNDLFGLTVQSLRGSQTKTFYVRFTSGMIFDPSYNPPKELKFSDLKKGQRVKINYACRPKEVPSLRFEITQIILIPTSLQ